jgi:hypothetical protein
LGSHAQVELDTGISPSACGAFLWNTLVDDLKKVAKELGDLLSERHAS